MERDWTLYDLDTEDEVKVSGDLVHFKQSELSFFLGDIIELIKLPKTLDIETKHIGETFSSEPVEEFLEAEDYTYWETEDSNGNIIVDINDGCLKLVPVTKSGNILGTLVLSADAIEELTPLLA